jgi:hypothetical protein
MEIIQGAMEYEDMNIVLRTEEGERESERDLSIYSMGDYPHVGCQVTSPTRIAWSIYVPLNQQFLAVGLHI